MLKNFQNINLMITKNTRIIEFLFYLIIIFYFLYSGEIYNFFVPENTQMKLGLFRDWKIVVNDIYCEAAFKPVATIMQKQNTIDKDGVAVEIQGKGRHDACVVPRAVPIVESMMALTLADHYLRSKTNKI